MKYFAVLVLVWAGIQSPTAKAGVDPASLLVRVYGFWLSQSPRCTNPIEVFSETSPSYSDFLQAPQIGTGLVDPGTYPCVIIKMSDVIQHVPEADEGTGCVAGTTYIQDVCGTSFPLTPKDLDGNSITCTDSTDTSAGDAVYVYASTVGTNTANNNSFAPPTSDTGDGTNGMLLESAYNAEKDSISQFIVNASGKIQTSTSTPTVCDMNQPSFAFRQVDSSN